MNHVSTRTIESKASPGARFVIKRMTKRRTDALNELQAPILEKLSPLQAEYGPLDAEFGKSSMEAHALVRPAREKLVESGMTAKEAAAQVPLGSVDFAPEKFQRWTELKAQINRIDEYELTPATVRFCLVRIEELEVTYPDAEGNDVTAAATLDLVMQHGPDELYGEIVLAIQRECGLLPEEVQELKSPSTSVAVDIETSLTGNATTAGNGETITIADVANSMDPANVAVGGMK